MNARQQQLANDGQQAANTADVDRPTAQPRKRHFNRPTTPELEALYFQVAVHLTKRETALFMHCLGRTSDGGKALAEMILNPSGDGQ